MAESSIEATRRDAERAGLKDLSEDQLDGLACVHCGRATRHMRPLEGRYGGCQLFVCADSIACAAAAEQLPGGTDA